MPSEKRLTPRLLLRPLQRRDARRMDAVLDDDVVEAQGWTAAHRSEWISFLRLNKTARALTLVICDRNTEEILGTVSVDVTRGEPTLGLILGPKGRGQGLGTEALIAALPYFRDLGIRTAVLETAEANEAMRRVAEAAGFVPEASFTHQLPNGTQIPAIRYRRAV